MFSKWFFIFFLSHSSIILIDIDIVVVVILIVIVVIIVVIVVVVGADDVDHCLDGDEDEGSKSKRGELRARGTEVRS